MLVNLSKRKVLHTGLGNKKFDYQVGGVNLEKVTEEKDLGVILDGSLKSNKQCKTAAGKANKILGIIKRTFQSDFKTLQVFSQTCSRIFNSSLVTLSAA